MDIASFATEIDSDLQKIRNGTVRKNRPPRYSQDFVFPVEGSVPYGILFDDESEEMIADGPFACGKTFYSTMKLHRRALYVPGEYAIVRKVKETIKRSVCKTYAKILGYDPLLSKKGYVKGNGGQHPQSYHYPNGSVIHILGMNHPDGFLSSEFHGIYVNQAEELTYEDWQLLARRARNGKIPQIWGDCNPSFPKHFLAPDPDSETQQVRNSPEIVGYRFQHKHNPEYWDRDKRAWTEKGDREIAKLKRMTGMRYKRGYLAEWCSAEGAVYEMYDPLRHDVDVQRGDFGADTSWYLSIDYGFTHPTSVGLWALENGTHTLFKEIYQTGLTIDDLLVKMDRMLSENRVPAVENVFVDHDAEHNERLERAGHGVTLAIKDILPGIDVVKKHLENGTIRFNRNSLIEADPELVGKPQRVTDEFAVYAHLPPDQRKGTGKDEYPIDKDNHGCDMTRYFAMGVEESDTYYPIDGTMQINESWGY